MVARQVSHVKRVQERFGWVLRSRGSPEFSDLLFLREKVQSGRGRPVPAFTAAATAQSSPPRVADSPRPARAIGRGRRFAPNAARCSASRRARGFLVAGARGLIQAEHLPTRHWRRRGSGGRWAVALAVLEPLWRKLRRGGLSQQRFAFLGNLTPSNETWRIPQGCHDRSPAHNWVSEERFPSTNPPRSGDWRNRKRRHPGCENSSESPGRQC
jgi:hypothetical protein